MALDARLQYGLALHVGAAGGVLERAQSLVSFDPHFPAAARRGLAFSGSENSTGVNAGATQGGIKCPGSMLSFLLRRAGTSLWHCGLMYQRPGSSFTPILMLNLLGLGRPRPIIQTYKMARWLNRSWCSACRAGLALLR